MRTMIVCKVAIGRPYELTHNAPQLTGPPEGYHSVHGKASASGSLNYDEYVVYDPRAVLPYCIIEYTYGPDATERDPTSGGDALVGPTALVCEEHGAKPKEVYCKTCQTLCCLVCVMYGDHRKEDGHESDLLTKVASSEREVLAEDLLALSRRREEIAQGLRTTEEMCNGVKFICEEVRRRGDEKLAQLAEQKAVLVNAQRAVATAEQTVQRSLQLPDAALLTGLVDTRRLVTEANYTGPTSVPGPPILSQPGGQTRVGSAPVDLDVAASLPSQVARAAAVGDGGADAGKVCHPQ
jgi:hypothetical protein